MRANAEVVTCKDIYDCRRIKPSQRYFKTSETQFLLFRLNLGARRNSSRDVTTFLLWSCFVNMKPVNMHTALCGRNLVGRNVRITFTLVNIETRSQYYEHLFR